MGEPNAVASGSSGMTSSHDRRGLFCSDDLTDVANREHITTALCRSGVMKPIGINRFFREAAAMATTVTIRLEDGGQVASAALTLHSVVQQEEANGGSTGGTRGATPVNRLQTTTMRIAAVKPEAGGRSPSTSEEEDELSADLELEALSSQLTLAELGKTSNAADEYSLTPPPAHAPRGIVERVVRASESMQTSKAEQWRMDDAIAGIPIWLALHQ